MAKSSFLTNCCIRARDGLLGLGFIAWAACAPIADSVVTECLVASDQASLFKGRWPVRPIPLAVVANDFNSSELQALTRAITTWNDHFSNAKGFRLFLSGSSPLLQVSSSGTRLTSSTACSQTLVTTTNFTGRIMIYKSASSWSFGSQVMGVTSLCPITVAGSPYRTFVSAVMELNYVDFFRSGKPVPDLESIVLHELGHLLGLDHSCNGSACSSATDEYREAVMYPTLGFDGLSGRQRRTLNANDQGRANCLYE